LCGIQDTKDQNNVEYNEEERRGLYESDARQMIELINAQKKLGSKMGTSLATTIDNLGTLGNSRALRDKDNKTVNWTKTQIDLAEKYLSMSDKAFEEVTDAELEKLGLVGTNAERGFLNKWYRGHYSIWGGYRGKEEKDSDRFVSQSKFARSELKTVIADTLKDLDSSVALSELTKGLAEAFGNKEWKAMNLDEQTKFAKQAEGYTQIGQAASVFKTHGQGNIEKTAEFLASSAAVIDFEGKKITGIQWGEKMLKRMQENASLFGRDEDDPFFRGSVDKSKLLAMGQMLSTATPNQDNERVKELSEQYNLFSSGGLSESELVDALKAFKTAMEHLAARLAP